jgi:CHASE2 domain-containing sensor protein
MSVGNWLTRAASKTKKGAVGFFHPVPKGGWGDFAKHYARALIWILLLTAFVSKLEQTGTLKGFDLAALDSFMHVPPAETSDNVIIVEITDQDYQEIFENRSPLCRDRLLRLVANVRSYNPGVIGVDVDTSDPLDISDSRQSCGDDAKAALAQLMEGRHSPVIWAEVPHEAGAQLYLTPVLSLRGKDGIVVGKLGDLTAGDPSRFVGIPRFPVDPDGLVRRYESEFAVKGTLESVASESTPSPPLPSLARALVDNSNVCTSPQVPAGKDSNVRVICPIIEASTRPVVFNFYGDRYRFPIIDAHEFMGNEHPELASMRSHLLGGKIVLIGGTYKASRDVYPTPVGPLAGVELNALAVQSDLSGGGIRQIDRGLELAADFIFGSLVVLIFFAWEKQPWSALAVTVCTMTSGAVFLSIALFNTSAYWFNFMPVIIGMALHQTIELAQQAGHLREKLEATKRDVRKLSGEAKRLNDQLVLSNLLWESRERDRERDQERGEEREQKVKARARGAGAG